MDGRDASYRSVQARRAGLRRQGAGTGQFTGVQAAGLREEEDLQRQRLRKHHEMCARTELARRDAEMERVEPRASNRSYRKLPDYTRSYKKLHDLY